MTLFKNNQWFDVVSAVKHDGRKKKGKRERKEGREEKLRGCFSMMWWKYSDVKGGVPSGQVTE